MLKSNWYHTIFCSFEPGRSNTKASNPGKYRSLCGCQKLYSVVGSPRWLMLAIILSCLHLRQWASPINKTTSKLSWNARADWFIHLLWSRDGKKNNNKPSQKNEFCSSHHTVPAEKFALNSQNYPWRSSYDPVIALQCKKWQIHARGRANSWKYAWSSRKASHIWREEWGILAKKSFSQFSIRRYYLEL